MKAPQKKYRAPGYSFGTAVNLALTHMIRSFWLGIYKQIYSLDKLLIITINNISYSILLSAVDEMISKLL